MLPATVSVPPLSPSRRRTCWPRTGAPGATGRGNTAYGRAARSFLRRWPDPQEWAARPLAARLAADTSTRPFLMFLMVRGRLRPG